MTQSTINRDKFGAFLSSFGKDLADIAIAVSSESIHAAVAKSTHYIYRKTNCDTTSTGSLYISDIPKVRSFLSTDKTPELNFTQEGKTGTLHIRSGNSSLQLPTTAHIESQTKVGLMAKTIEQSRESMWRTWFNKPLTIFCTTVVRMRRCKRSSFCDMFLQLRGTPASPNSHQAKGSSSQFLIPSEATR